MVLQCIALCIIKNMNKIYVLRISEKNRPISIGEDQLSCDYFKYLVNNIEILS